MRKIVFNRVVLSDAPGYEMDYYHSEDVDGTCITQRGAFVLVLEQLFNYVKEDLDLVDEFILERMLLEHDVYVCFEDSYGEEE